MAAHETFGYHVLMVSFDPDAAAPPGSGLFGLDTPRDQAAISILPVPFAATVSYGGGAENGPSAVLVASRQVDLYDWHGGRIYEAGIHWCEVDGAIEQAHRDARALAEQVIAEGGSTPADGRIAAVDRAGELVNERVRAFAAAELAAGRIPGILGGDHSVPFGAIQAAAAHHPGLGVLHVDAHADLRDAYEGFRWSHASIMHNVLAECPQVQRLVQVGIRDYGEGERRAIERGAGRVVTHFDAEWQRRRFAGETFDALMQEALAALPAKVWVSFDIDGLDPSLCPNTGTPVPGGLSFAEAAHLLFSLAASGRSIVGFDLVEVAPGAGEWDANVGARVLYKMCGAAIRARAAAIG